MKPFRLYSRALILTYGLVASLFYSLSEAAVAPAPPAPAQQESVQIVRTATSATPLSFSLSKNVMKTETYDSEYTVQVPYETTETYTEQVPYQATETYTEHVPYETTETYTERVPYTTQVPYTDYETDYRNEYICHDHRGSRNECHNEQKCYIVPGNGGGSQCRPVTECGTNAQGQEICKTREVCDGGGDSGPAQHCDNQQVCQEVPTNEQQCGYEQVPYQHQVTKYRTETQYRDEARTRTVTHYRDETRTRTVTKYRDETRTRTVTKYRTETKCCVSKTREVFDHQLQYQVSVAIPAEAVLAANESEKLQFKLISTEPAVVEMTTLSSSYRYKIVNQSVTGASVLIELAVLPKYDLTNVGPSVISGMKLDYSTSADRFQITFVDSLKSDEIRSGYYIVVSDDKGNVIEQLPANGLDSSGKSVTRIKTSIAKTIKLTATLKVFRISARLADGSLNFEVVIKN